MQMHGSHEPVDLDKVLDRLPDYVIVLNLNGDVVFFNEEAARLHQMVGRPIAPGAPFPELVEPIRREKTRDIIRLLASGIQANGYEASLLNESGYQQLFEISYRAIYDENGKLFQVCLVGHDITLQRIHQAREGKVIDDMSVLIDNANALIFAIDGSRYITIWNKECSRSTQMEKEEVFARKLDAVIDSGPEFDNLLSDVMGGKSVSNQELIVKTRGESIVSLTNITPMRNINGEVVGALFMGQDITELVKYRRFLEQEVDDRTRKLKEALAKERDLINVKNRFISIASHEFKMPLESISASTRHILSNPKLRKTDVHEAKDIERYVSHMKDLLADVLEAEKGEFNKVKANLSPVNLTEFLQNLTSEIAAVHQSHRIVTEFPKGTVEISSDEKLLRNIFVNLLTNAIKFSPGREEIVLSVVVLGEKVAVVVRDDGIGIPAEDVERIFEPFNRASNVSGIRGTGLGLSIVKKAVEALDGELVTESVFGVGTTMIVRFNLKAK